ncbi:N4-gp56 family major capsid protein [Candidatus Parcubacteria bacterium]|nr:MAG: N4-gp56 family major capsid protein [Candidatus Parcubacteria bacterium]
MQQYATQAPRIGKLKGEILAHAIPVEVLGITGQQKQMPKNNSDTVVFRRYLPYGGTDNQWINAGNVGTFASAHQTTEGTTPTADTLTAVDVTANLQQYAVLYAVTDKVVDMYEDDIPAEMKRQTGERIGLVREMVRFGALKAATNVFYAGGTSRATVSATISLPLLRKVARTLQANHAKQITSILSPSPNIGTSPIEASYLVFCHSDLEPAIRDLPGYVGVHQYGSRKPVHPQELGSVERFRFIVSPELAQYADAGAATTTATGLESTSGTNIDVYPVIVVGEDAWGQVALRGMDSLDVTYIPPGSKDKNDPLGQRGYIGAKTYFTALVLNQGWMAVIEAGAPAL